MGEFIEAIRKLREEIEKQEREKTRPLEKITDSIAKGEKKVNKLRNESGTPREEVATVDPPVATEIIDFLLRVNIIENT